MRSFLVALLVLVLTGCAIQNARLYEGPERPNSEVAVLSVTGESGVPTGVTIIVRKISGKPAPGGASFYLLPGDYLLDLEVSKDMKLSSGKLSWKQANVQVTFRAEAGHTYIPVAVIREDTASAVIKDVGQNFPQECLPIYIAINESTNPGHSIHKDGRKCNR